jgi:hypothetical protein
MSARTKLEAMFPGQTGVNFADEILNAYAHELAEEIRDDLEQRIVNGAPFWEVDAGMREAADLIDPEVKR